MTVNVNIGNWRTTIAGILGATANLIISWLQGALDTRAFVISFAIAALGYFAKDATTGSAPGDTGKLQGP